MEALAHAVSARDWPYVGHVVATQAAPLILSAHRGALVKVLQQVPPEKMTSSPELVFCAGLLLFHAGDYEAIPARISRARELLRRRRDVAARRPIEIMLFTLALMADRAVGDMPAIIANSTELLDLLATDSSGDGSVAAQHRAIATCNRGLALLWTGQPEAAGRDLWAGAARTVGLELTEINATGHLALLHIICGSAHDAAQLAAGARDLAERRGWMYTLQTVPAHLAQALVDLERHDLDSAQEALRQGVRAHHSNREAAQRLVLLGIEARLATARGEPARARRFLAEAGRDRSPRLHAPTLDRWLSLINAEVDLAAGLPASPEIGESGLVPDQALDFPHRIVRARSAFAARDLRRADELLAANPTTLPQTVATVEAGVLGALVADARGQATRAVDQLADAVTLAAREGIRRPFFTLSGSRLDEILHRLQLLGGDAPFVQQAIGETRATRKLPADIATVQGLSERELEVLRYLPTMLTAAEIAADLGVSVNTIKVHMQSIYRKLGVNRRGNAVAQARDNGIL
jgi:LuxR family maltose regulon positive regulatory protein